MIKLDTTKVFSLVGPVLSGLAVLILLGALIGVIFFTALEWQWVAFLSGILFASVMSLVVRASRVEWRAARRTSQLQRFRDRLTEEAQRAATLQKDLEEEHKRHESYRDRLTQELTAHERDSRAMKSAEGMLVLIADSLPSLIMYADRGLICRFHNRGFRVWRDRPAEQVNGVSVAEVLGEGAFSELKPRLEDALDGKRLHFEFAHRSRAGGTTYFHVELIPHQGESDRPAGLFALFTDVTELKRRQEEEARRARAPGEPATAAGRYAPTDEGGQGIYVSALNDELTGWADAAERISQALEHDEFLLYHQAIIALKEDAEHPPMHEVLVRLKEEEDSMAPPGAFLPIAERYGLMPALDRWVVRRLVQWRSANRGNPEIFSVNIAEDTLRDPTFGRFVEEQLQTKPFDPKELVFEVSERDAFADVSVTAAFINDMKRLGCRVAVDGFGRSGVSFSRLKDLRLDFLKIDGSIIRDITRDQVALAKAKGVARVCSVVGIRTVAEFVETEEIIAQLRGLGVDYAQGFGISRPQPLERPRDQRPA